jgi:putative FmdB family regulatory protein
MPLYDYECPRCGKIEEHYALPDEKEMACSCGVMARRIFSPGNKHPNEDAGWIASVLEVVDKEGGPHCQAFLKDPTRTNYRNWMKAEGLRPFEDGEKPGRPSGPDMGKIRKEVWEKDVRRRRIEL